MPNLITTENANAQGRYAIPKQPHTPSHNPLQTSQRLDPAVPVPKGRSTDSPLEDSHHSATSCGRDRLELDCELGEPRSRLSRLLTSRVARARKGLHSSCYLLEIFIERSHSPHEGMTPCAPTSICHPIVSSREIHPYGIYLFPTYMFCGLRRHIHTLTHSLTQSLL